MKDVNFGETGDGANGTFISIIPDGNRPERDVARFTKPFRPKDDWQMRKRSPPVRVQHNCTLFAMAFPREAGEYGYRYYLIDRDGKRWPLGG